MEHGLVQELAAKKRRALCFITGVIRTTKESAIRAKLQKGTAAKVQAKVKYLNFTQRRTSSLCQKVKLLYFHNRGCECRLYPDMLQVFRNVPSVNIKSDEITFVGR